MECVVVGNRLDSISSGPGWRRAPEQIEFERIFGRLRSASAVDGSLSVEHQPRQFVAR